MKNGCALSIITAHSVESDEMVVQGYLCFRVEIKKGENGKHQLILHKIDMKHDGLIEAK